ncbi:hypothetical protein GCM10018771_67980 [Streptomyces cellulosae]|nr:hypothetical protein GCM10018771_67980 [Streptomyces cellulosae]
MVDVTGRQDPITAECDARYVDAHGHYCRKSRPTRAGVTRLVGTWLSDLGMSQAGMGGEA